jgi:hypothetical protein
MKRRFVHRLTMQAGAILQVGGSKNSEREEKMGAGDAKGDGPMFP